MNAQLLRDQIITHDWFPRRAAEYYRWYPKTLHQVDPLASVEVRASEIEGIYLHIPFCDEICRFCPFNKQTTSEEVLDRYVTALVRQIEQLGGSAAAGGISFVYFGGGTPSVLTARQVEKILDAIARRCSIGNTVEITLEAHPRDCTDEYLSQLKSAGVNRISSGVQSFSDRILSTIHATHTAELSHGAVAAMSKNFDNWGLDLLYRCPGQSTGAWEEEFKTLSNYASPAHISCYSLFLPDDSAQPTAVEDVDQAIIAQTILEDAGFAHYASCATGGFDYAKPGHECAYEKRHWGAPQASYAAFGSGAIGFLSGRTTVNYHDTSRYIEAVEKGRSTIFLTSKPDTKELKRRFMVLGVKVLEVDLRQYEQAFESSAQIDFEDEFRSLEEGGMIGVNATTLKLTNLGRYYVDQISEVFWSSRERDTLHPETSALRAMEQKAYAAIRKT
ncbi:MAG: coproporphyrinogen-III oxidase family protein [Pyrinomonadaceae bacterium]